MIDFEKTLKEWKTFSEEEKEQYFLFTLFLARWHGMDPWWSSRECALDDNDMRRLEQWLPVSILQDKKKKEEKENADFEKECMSSYIESEIKQACNETLERYENYYLSSQIQYSILYDIENELRQSLETKKAENRYANSITMKIEHSNGCLLVKYNATTPHLMLKYYCEYKIEIVDDELKAIKIDEDWK